MGNAKLTPVVFAIRSALKRDQKSIGAFASNIFFPVVIFLLMQAGVFILLLAGLILLFPLSSDPMRKLPSERLALWPLTAGQHRRLRWITPWLNPVTWLLFGAAVWGLGRSISFGLWGAVAAIVAVGFFVPSLPLSPRLSAGAWIPSIPGPLGQLMRLSLRQILTTLDFWMALLISVCTGLYRLFGAPLPAEALLMMSLLVVLAFASYCSCLFGLDGPGGLTRYRLLPLTGWHLVAVKDVSILIVIFVLTLPLATLPALAAALTILAIGNGLSVAERRPQIRWRFSTGTDLPKGLAMLLGLAFSAAGVFYQGPWVIALCFTAYVASLLAAGWQIDKGRLATE